MFRVASSLGFLIGLAMFGAIIFIPLFLQLVYGVSPTSSGLRMLPLMAGLLAASVLSGRAISRIGRYKAFPIAGTAVTTLGMFLLSRLEVETAPWVASVYMLVVGIGIGLTMQVLVLVVQNDAPPKRHRRRDLDRDVLPLDGRLARRRAVRRDLRRPPQQRAPGPGPRASASRAASTSARTRSTRCRAVIRFDFLHAFVDALQPVFLVGAALTCVAFGLAWLLREVPLRGTTAAADLAKSAEAAVAAPDHESVSGR